MNWEKLKKYINTTSIFYTILILNIFLLCTIKFYPTLDGPSHLYNSNLIKNILGGSELNTYFIFNNFYIPNWTSHFFLTIFQFFAPGWLSEKFFIILYLASLSISFKLLIQKLNPESIGLSIIIFPFAFGSLFYLGFFNYCISFVFMFMTINYWINFENKKSKSKYIILFLLLAFTYYSAVLSFFFLGFILGCFTLYKQYKKGRFPLKYFLKGISGEILTLLLISLPFLIFFYLFLFDTNFYPTNQTYSIFELIKWITNIHPIIVFDFGGEKRLTQLIFFIFVLVIVLSIYKSVKENKINLNPFHFPMLLSLLLLFLIPDSSSSGMMSHRFILMFYMIFIIWFASQKISKKLLPIIMLVIASVHLGLLFKRHNATMRALNTTVCEIYNSSKYIKKNKIVLPVNLSTNWIQGHFSNYLGIDKPLVILENYEASVGWFPLKWNTTFPNIKLANKSHINNIIWSSNEESKVIKQIDYVYLFGKLNELNLPEWKELKEILKSDYKLIYTSLENEIAIYKFSN